MTRRLALVLMLAAGCGEAVEGTPDGGGTSADAAGGVQATFTSLYGDYFQNCKSCHATDAPGRTNDTEMTLNFDTQATAHSTITTGMASGLVGNFADCNGVPFFNEDMPSMSLILAALDQPTRNMFDDPNFPDCAMDTIADQTLKVGTPPSPAFIAALKEWLEDGAPNN